MASRRPIRPRPRRARYAARMTRSKSAASVPRRARPSGGAISAWSRSTDLNATERAARSPLGEAAVLGPPDGVAPAVPVLVRLAYRSFVDLDPEARPFRNGQIAIDG